MKQDLRPKWFQPLHYQLRPWKVCTTPPGSTPPTLYERQWEFLYVPHESEKSCETGPMVFPYSRRPSEHLTICRCHNKGSVFSSVSILRPWLLVRPGFEQATSQNIVICQWRADQINWSAIICDNLSSIIVLSFSHRVNFLMNICHWLSANEKEEIFASNDKQNEILSLFLNWAKCLLMSV